MMCHHRYLRYCGAGGGGTGVGGGVEQWNANTRNRSVCVCVCVCACVSAYKIGPQHLYRVVDVCTHTHLYTYTYTHIQINSHILTCIPVNPSLYTHTHLLHSYTPPTHTHP